MRSGPSLLTAAVLCAAACGLLRGERDDWNPEFGRGRYDEAAAVDPGTAGTGR